MGNVSNRTKGKVEELAGRAKAGLGRVIGNERMEIEGTAKRIKGKAKQEAAKAKGRVQGSVEEVTGRIRTGVGVMLDDEQMQAAGKLQGMTGTTRQRVNR